MSTWGATWKVRRGHAVAHVRTTEEQRQEGLAAAALEKQEQRDAHADIVKKRQQDQQDKNQQKQQAARRRRNAIAANAAHAVAQQAWLNEHDQTEIVVKSPSQAEYITIPRGILSDDQSNNEPSQRTNTGSHRPSGKNRTQHYQFGLSN